MTIRELAAALADLPERFQGLQAMMEDEGNYIPVMTVCHLILEFDPETVAQAVELTGWVEPTASIILYQERLK